MDGDAYPLSLALALVEEAEPWREEGEDGGGTVLFRREGGGGPWLVVVLEEAGQAVLEVEARIKVLADRPRVALRKTVVKPLVVGVIEALLLQGPFEVPIDLGEEEEAGDPRTNGRRGPRPERGCGDSPRLLEDLRQDEHRHVTPDSIALTGDLRKLAELRLLK